MFTAARSSDPTSEVKFGLQLVRVLRKNAIEVSPCFEQRQRQYFHDTKLGAQRWRTILYGAFGDGARLHLHRQPAGATKCYRGPERGGFSIMHCAGGARGEENAASEEVGLPKLGHLTSCSLLKFFFLHGYHAFAVRCRCGTLAHRRRRARWWHGASSLICLLVLLEFVAWVACLVVLCSSKHTNQ